MLFQEKQAARAESEEGEEDDEGAQQAQETLDLLNESKQENNGKASPKSRNTFRIRTLNRANLRSIMPLLSSNFEWYYYTQKTSTQSLHNNLWRLPFSDRYEDQYVIQFFMEKLLSMPCQNQGFVLDGFPKTYSQAKELFGNKDEPEDEDAPRLEYNTKIMPGM